MGGNTDQGIMSGVAPRQGYKTSGLVDQLPELQKIAKQYAYRPTGYTPAQGLIDFGLNLASAEPRGSIFSTAAEAAKKPFEKYTTSKAESEAARYVSEADMFKSLIEAQGSIMGGEGGPQWQKQWEAGQIPELVKRIAELEDKENLTTEEENELRSNRILLDKYSPDDPFVEWFLKEPKAGLAMYKDIKEKLKIADAQSATPKYDPNLGDDDPQLIADTFVEFRKQVRELRATGGRVGYANAGSVLPYRGHLNQGSPSIMSKAGTDTEVEDAYGVSVADAAMPEELSGISYEELRARLPQEVSDEIVRLLANSPEALEDFAVIQTEQDIANFNKKYGVNLVLPAEA